MLFLLLSGKYLNGELMQTLAGYSNERASKLCSLDAPFLAVAYTSETGTLGKNVRILNSKTGNVLARLAGHTADVRALVDLTNNRLASGSADESIKIWNWRTGLVDKNLTGGTGTGIVEHLCLIKRETLISYSSHGRIDMWNITTGRFEKNLFFSFLRSLTSLNDGGNNFATAFNTEVIALSVINEVINRLKLTGHKEAVESLAYVETSKLASGSVNGIIKVWNCENGAELYHFSAFSHRITSLVALTATGHLASGSSDKTIRIWNLDSSLPSNLNRTLFGHDSPILSLALLKDGNLASGFNDGIVKVWHFSATSNFSSMQGHFFYLLIMDLTA
jgi:WD40 repeat protein